MNNLRKRPEQIEAQAINESGLGREMCDLVRAALLNDATIDAPTVEILLAKIRVANEHKPIVYLGYLLDVGTAVLG